jgi:hypothetical protein
MIWVFPTASVGTLLLACSQVSQAFSENASNILGDSIGSVLTELHDSSFNVGDCLSQDSGGDSSRRNLGLSANVPVVGADLSHRNLPVDAPTISAEVCTDFVITCKVCYSPRGDSDRVAVTVVTVVIMMTVLW